jgi:hypothetical protein
MEGSSWAVLNGVHSALYYLWGFWFTKDIEGCSLAQKIGEIVASFNVHY